ncbi:hypothetical protein [Actinoalloteichus hymeniacidonis]|uniref:DUF2580 family protein n=1 Tax=Actinoalloteichus hymeniacidonis TaxID=340345 RepID=A0AAC9HU67_9PSEU|nr:hypothetical protein [Actinoalloteichus hymeniacidonis]AOS65772.1 putative DUF2580 family protein [Actinoalloteichus hymeniacidonis]MBB5906137.1 hypothetical protein [Actinoalloteichus hymeniacidonis]
MSDAISIDIDWLNNYAKSVNNASDDMQAADESLNEARISAESFGELGAEVGTDVAYARVADHLYQQAQRGCEVLAAAAAGLRNVVTMHQTQDDDAARELARNE